QPRASLNLDWVSEVVADSSIALRMDRAGRREVLDQRSAERDVQHLLSTTDPERRNFALTRPLREPQLQPVEWLGHPDPLVDLLAEMARMDVQAARKEDPVQRREDPLQRVGVVERLNEDR